MTQYPEPRGDAEAQSISADEKAYAGSRYAEVREALYANPYRPVWGAPDEPEWPRYKVTLGHVTKGILPGGKKHAFSCAAARTVDSFADLRWGPDGNGFRRILHPNGICLFGTWRIDQETPYTGYFRQGSRALVIARASVDGSETRWGGGNKRSPSLVGKIYPTEDPDHPEPLEPANFFTQDDLGRAKRKRFLDADLRNAPNITLLNRGKDAPILALSGLVFDKQDAMSMIRQTYPIAELGKPAGEPTRAPKFLQFNTGENVLQIDEDDFRDELMAHIYDRGNPTPQRRLKFEIFASDEGTESGNLALGGLRRHIDWGPPIGRLVFHEAVASYNGDFVFHCNHPTWRTDRNDPKTGTRVDGKKVAS